ncbi:MAG: cupredoxin domain-containing protein [Nitrospiraceae bacterium]
MPHLHQPSPRAHRVVAATGWIVAVVACTVFTGMPLHVSASLDQPPVVITIKARQFHPSLVTLRVGQPAMLVFENLDTELHSFVPQDLLRGVNLNIGGNGAPEFGEEGFKRVIIPPEGRAEIRFTPANPGEFGYICDMPGHQMRAQIVVEHGP